MNVSDFDSFMKDSGTANFSINVENLKKSIQNKIDNIEKNIALKMKEEDTNCSEQIEAWNKAKSVYKQLLSLSIKTTDDYNYVSWMFNNGNLRNEEELSQFRMFISEREKKENKAKIMRNKRYRIWHGIFMSTILWLPFAVAIVLAIYDTARCCDLSMFFSDFICGLFVQVYIAIPEVIVAALISIGGLHALDAIYKTDHDGEDDAIIAGIASAMATTIYIGNKANSHKRSNKEI